MKSPFTTIGRIVASIVVLAGIGYAAVRYFAVEPEKTVPPIPLALNAAQTVEPVLAPARPPIDTLPIPKTWDELMNKIGYSSDSDEKHSVEKGKALAERHCTSCHALPDPSILPKASWLDLAAQKHDIMVYLGQISNEIVASTCYPRVSLAFPPESQVGSSMPRRELAAIFHYYYSHAPAMALPQAEKAALSSAPAPFAVKAARMFAPPYPAFLSVSIASGRIVAANVASRLDVFDAGGGFLHSVPLPGAPTAIVKGPGGWYVTIKGSSFVDRAAADGMVVRFAENAFESPDQVAYETMAKELRRPQLTRFADVDGDGSLDMLIGETGGRDGALTVRRNLGGDVFGEPQVIFDGPGTEWLTPFDANDDGEIDILSLVGLGEQTAYLFLNNGDGTFERSTVASHFAGFGYRHAEPVDLNDDGRPDIVTTNGNRMNLLSFPLKNYHGVRILGDDGNGKYRERFFYPMHGVGGTVARDFDGDGDQDLVAAAFSPDFDMQPLESIVYLENKGDFQFTPHRIPEAEDGRWTFMAMGDLDGDGQEELVLTAAYPPPQDSRTQGVFGDGERNGILVLSTNVPANE